MSLLVSDWIALTVIAAVLVPTVLMFAPRGNQRDQESTE